MSKQNTSRSDKAHKGAGPGRRTPAPCPICGKMSVAAYHPFCSRRCADIDLGRWLGERYAIAGRAEEDEDGERGRAPPDDGSTGEDDGGGTAGA